MSSKQNDEAYWDRVAGVYTSLYDNEWSRYEDEILRHDIQRLIGSCNVRRILDVGCGTGLCYELSRSVAQGVEYVGLDVSTEMLANFATRFPNVVLIHGSADSLLTHFAPASFDLVLSTNVAASFWSDVSSTLAEILTLLIPGGQAYLSFLNRTSLRRLLQGRFHHREQYRTRGDPDTEQFVWAHTFTWRELRRLFENTGFVHLKADYRSVLGGVWETQTAIRIERVLASTAPWLSHSVAVTAQRPV